MLVELVLMFAGGSTPAAQETCARRPLHLQLLPILFDAATSRSGPLPVVRDLAETEAIVDIVRFSNPDIIDQFYLARLRAAEPIDATGRLTRYTIPLARNGKVRAEPVADAPIELPRIHYARHAGKPYRAVWGNGNHRPGDFLDSIVKIDTETGACTNGGRRATIQVSPCSWQVQAQTGKDAGVLLSVVLDARRNRSYLLVLDAESLGEIARAECPHHIPFGFHGNYFPASGGPLSLDAIHR